MRYRALVALAVALAVLVPSVPVGSQVGGVWSMVMSCDGNDPDDVWHADLNRSRPRRVSGLRGWACEAEGTSTGATLWCVAGTNILVVSRLGEPGSLMLSVDCRSSREDFASLALSDGRWRGIVSLVCNRAP